MGRYIHKAGHSKYKRAHIPEADDHGYLKYVLVLFVIMIAGVAVYEENPIIWGVLLCGVVVGGISWPKEKKIPPFVEYNAHLEARNPTMDYEDVPEHLKQHWDLL